MVSAAGSYPAGRGFKSLSRHMNKIEKEDYMVMAFLGMIFGTIFTTIGAIIIYGWGVAFLSLGVLIVVLPIVLMLIQLLSERISKE